MKPVVYHRLADIELAKSAVFYERRREFLGEAFLNAVEETLVEIQNHSNLGHPGKFSTRSWRTKRFPFRMVYLEAPDRIWIVAVAHLSRRPNYWLERLD